MGERDHVGYLLLALMLLGAVALGLTAIRDEIRWRGEIVRDLQRRVGQLESERR